MLEQIQEIVKKNLPAEVGDQLKKHLNEAEATARKLQEAEGRLETYRKASERDLMRIAELEAKLKTSGELDKREQEVTKREVRLDAHNADMRAQAAEHRAQAVYDLAALAFRSPRILRTTQESESVPVVINGYTQQTTKSKTTDEATEQH